MKHKSIIEIALSIGILLSAAASAENISVGDSLYMAVLSGDVPEVKKLLAAKADPNFVSQGRSVLGWAAQSESVEVVKTLLSAGANPNTADANTGHTPLMRAIDTNLPEIVQALLQAKANPNAKNMKGQTCLMMAAESRNAEIVKLLIGAGADVKYVDAEGNSPALIAAQDGMEESLKIIEILGKAKATLDTSNAAYTPLTYAISQDRKDLVEVLLRSGANPNAKTASGTLPIFAALGNKEILEVLLKGKADPNVLADSGNTPLIEAIQNNNGDATKVLLENGAKAGMVNKAGLSPLEAAGQGYQSDLAELLKAHMPKEADTKQYKEYSIEPVTSNGTTCSIVDAAKRQMEIHAMLQKQVDAGKMSDDIFRTYNKDLEPFGTLLTENPAEACRLLDRLQKKYGL